MKQNEAFVRRRRWTRDQRRALVEEAEASGNVIGAAKRHGIQAEQIYRWRDRLFGRVETTESPPCRWSLTRRRLRASSRR